MNLRPYQQQARYWVNQQLNQSNNPLLVAPTGTGKTKTGTQIIIDRISMNERSLILVPQIEIFDEWQKEFSNNNINYGYINDEGIIGKNKDIYICMYQSLSNILNAIPEKFCKSFSNIFTDEAHRGQAESYHNIYNHFLHCSRAGWTATPYRLDNKPLGQFYNIMSEAIKMTEAIENKYLCKPYLIIPDEYKNFIPGQDDIYKIDKNEQRQLVKDKKIIGDMLKVYSDVFNGLPVIIPCAGFDHARIVFEMYESAGWKVGHLHSKLNKHERRRIINDVKKKKTNILITVGVGCEGMNIKGLYGIIWMRFTESLTIYMQFNGRAMRPDTGKEIFIMVDPVGVSVIHGRPDINRKWSLTTDYVPGQDISDTTTMKICPVCDTMNAQENNHCWICHFDFTTGLLDGQPIDKKRRKLPKFVDGKLVWLEGREEIDGNNNNNFDRISNIDLSGSSNKNNMVGSNSENNLRNLSKSEKVDILKRDLIGLRNKNLFREGVKWL
jgi:superfamily II DNA or RNA helicase